MEAIEIFGEELPNSVTLPAAKHLLKINEDYIHLDEHRSELFYYVTAKFYIL